MNRKSLFTTFCLLSSVFCLLTLFPGCNTSSTERVAAATSVVNQANSVSQSVNASIADINQVIAAAELLLTDPNITIESKAELQAALVTARTKLSGLAVQKQKVDNVLLQAQAILNAIDTNNVDSQAELSAYGNIATSVAPSLPASVSGYVYLAGLLIPVLGGLVTKLLIQIRKIKQQTAEINQSKTVLTEVVSSVDALLDSDIVVTNKKAAKQILQSNQTGKTQDVVDAIHDPKKNTGPN